MSEAEKILLVWDDADMVKTFSFFFREHGYFVDSVETYENCLELCLTNPPHILIVNRSFDQPGIALEFIRKLRSHPSISYIPIIVGNANFTKNKEEYGHLESFKIGANACFGHVFGIDDVLKQVKILIEDPTKTNLVDKNIAQWYGDSNAV